MNYFKAVRILTWGSIVVLSGFLLVSAGVPGLLLNSKPTAETRPIGRSWALTTQHGEPVSDVTLAGKPYLAFFGFTNCPDICPTTLFELTDLMRELGTDADAFNVVFITVDPDRDTPELLVEYMTSFDSRIIAARGDRQQTDNVVKAFAAYAKRVPTEGGGYTMDHTAGVYLFKTDGSLKSMLDMHEPRDTRLLKLRHLAVSA